ncbi:MULTISPECIES: hypothetical protein [Streptomyces]|uniref:Uncharacterized protein n=1 Tax=Streptomyces chartreusis NRRL 3882 TaxID=1079985 RepID=A0A2N9B876_STRCX|nr:MULTISPECIES: hypothetical protein [Streptomyces]MYS92459.1 hypothetical protein [Streptomyces sp. SID5464]SOR79540.1 hypothetical protein SCNRRL3882_3002 [Streptomyces chartreusis NRRL 3882]
MADEQYRWLDRETAERLLSGEPPEAVDGAARGEAERLAAALRALSAAPPLTSEELPGEAAAMAAFRKARAERADTAAAPAADGGRAGTETADAGLVRIGTPRGSGSGDVRRPRWARPARLALAAVLAVGMTGGAALVAGTGALRAPFGNDEPQPGSSVSAAVTPPERPLVSPSPSDAVQGGSTPDDNPGGGDPGRDAAGDDPAPKPGSGDRGDRGDSSGDSRRGIAAACRDLRDGKRLDADRRRALRDAAGGSRVWKYCNGVLSGSGAGGRSAQRHDEDTDRRDRDDRSGKQGRERDEAEKKAQKRAERKAGKRAERQAGEDAAADRGRSTRSLTPLRPAISYSAKISSPRV